MPEIVTRLRALGAPLLPPASEAAIIELRATLRAAFGLELPAEVEALYADHGGCQPNLTFPFRLLAPAEVPEVIAQLVAFGVPFHDAELGVFWADDNSNHAGVFAAGPLQGRVFLFDHEDPSPEPIWRSIDSFYDAVVDAAEHGLNDLYDMATDYPRPLDDVNADDDLLAGRLFARYSETPHNEERQQTAFQALALCSTLHSDDVLHLLRSDDMWVQERAAEILGGWHLLDAVDALAQVARGGSHNGRLAAVLALQKIPSPEARRQVDLLRDELGPNCKHFFR